MKANSKSGELYYHLTGCASTLLLCLLLTACTRSDVGRGATPVTSPTPSVHPTSPLDATQTPFMTPTLTGRELDATKMAGFDRRQHAIETRAASIALGTRFPTPRPIQVPTVVMSPWTPTLGNNTLCAEASHYYHYEGCWTGLINGEYFFVSMGSLLSDSSQGVLEIFTRTLDLQYISPNRQYLTPIKAGIITEAYANGQRLTVFTLPQNSNQPTTTFVFNLLTRTWEDPGPCPLYPVALQAGAVQGMRPRFELRDVSYGSGIGNFGWLNWSGVTGEISDTLALSLIPPGDSFTYVNPDNPTDHTVSVGDWVVGASQVSNSQAVGTALTNHTDGFLRVVVPLWDQVATQGNALRYHISGFARVYIHSYSLAQPNRLSFRYWGPVACPDS